MLPSLYSPTTFSFLTFVLSSLFSLSTLSLCPSVLAQEFRPAPNDPSCSAYIEGRGMYILGGIGDDNFMLDLSVSLNTSDPVFKRLEGGPRSMGNPCAVTKDELFMLVEGTGYVYNVSSSSWRVVNNGYFGIGQEYISSVASADPGTGIVYIMNGLSSYMLSVDLITNAYNQSEVTRNTMGNSDFFVWNEYLKGMMGDNVVYTPSKVSTSSDGWSQFVVSGWPLSFICGAAAYGGKKMVFLQHSGPVFTLDVVKKTWTKGPQGPGHWLASCAMTGDQFIIWGGMILGNTAINETFVFNVKTQKWISRYTAPPSRSITTTTTILHTSQLTTPTQNVQNATSSAGLSDLKIITIVIIITGIVLAVNIWLIVRHRRAKRLKHEGSSTDSLNIKEDHASDSSGPLGRLHQGPFGARPLSEHPHATVKDLIPERNVQEGAQEVHFPPQQPHAMVGKEFDPIYTPQQPHAMVGNEFDPMYSAKVIGEPTRYYGKAELEDQ
ncbi:MAG: hypothetical protein J3Q66DRAFT_347405 [Benniella sp.]|nr:MAG: hypothetical protein J3Q66DRAFT_347405 [Benniella sp.]